MTCQQCGSSDVIVKDGKAHCQNCPNVWIPENKGGPTPPTPPSPPDPHPHPSGRGR